MSDDQEETQDVAATKPAPAKKRGKASSDGKDRKIAADDLTSIRVLNSFDTYGPKGAFRFQAGMKVLESDIKDYFPSQGAYRNRMQMRFIGLPSN